MKHGPPGKLVSHGNLCLSASLARRAEADQPTFPFDDVFSTVAIVNDCLEDGFETFLRHTDYLAGDNDQRWVPRAYRERFGAPAIFAHHDMRLAENQAKFRRRVERFLDLDSADAPLFLVIASAESLRPDDYVALRTNLQARFGISDVLAIQLGPEPDADSRAWEAAIPDLRVHYYQPRSEMLGTAFADEADNEAIIALIRANWPAGPAVSTL